MNSSRARKGVLALAFLLLCNCVRRESPITPPAREENASFNQSALFLAGMKGPENGPFHALESDPAWRRYSADLNATWTRLNTEQFKLVSSFETQNLSVLPRKGSYVFYPFGGPDVLYATRLFPSAQTYVLAGLERVGEIGDPQQYRPKHLERDLNGWRQALNSIFERSFFVTSEMDSQFHGRVANGLLPMILLLLARAGFTIDNAHYGHLDPSGAFIYEQPASNIRHMGVEIDFHRAGESVNRKLFYFSTRLGPEFEYDPSFARFLDRQGTPDTLVKSASFLLHWEMCKSLRSYILAKSNLILEDDTGIPYRYFLNPGWQVQLFGEYSRPDRPFHREYQRDLASAFLESGKAKPLGFNLGYGAGRRPSSMLLAVRTK